MRHTSALKIIGFMRRNFGIPLSISAICRGVELSYQPVHFHIRELENLGVLGVRKEGRASICRFVASETASLWLALYTAQSDVFSETSPDATAEDVQTYLAESWPKYECISCTGEEGRAIVVPSAPVDEELAGECEDVFAAWDLQVFSPEDFAAFLETGEGVEWIRSADVLFGHQRFWRYALAAGVASGLVVPADGVFLSERD